MGSGAPSPALSSRMQERKPTRIEGQGSDPTSDKDGTRAGRQAHPTREQGKQHHHQHHPPTRTEAPAIRNATKERAGATRERGKGKRAERKKGGDKPTSPQKGVPPHSQLARRCSPPQFFAPKNQQKVAWVALKKFSEKFFVGMFRGQRKTPCVISTEGGC